MEKESRSIFDLPIKKYSNGWVMQNGRYFTQ